MDRLSRLKIALSDMTHDQRLEMLRSIRQERIATRLYAKKKERHIERESTMESIFKKMSPEDRAALLASIQESEG